MRKTIVIMTVFALSSLWGQKEIPTSVGDGEEVIDERVSANQSNSINPEMIQQIRAFKATKEKMHIKKEPTGVIMVGVRTNLHFIQLKKVQIIIVENLV